MFLLIALYTISKSQKCPALGKINFQKWDGIPGSSINDLASNANYPNTPSSSGTLTTFEIPVNAGDNYGIKVYGYICPPTTGNYVFWIAGDEATELWLSTSSNPANKVKIAYNTTYTGSRQWTKYATQKSVTIALSAGNKYYVEALMKEGTGNDNMAVAWSKPGESTSAPSQVIPGSGLSVNSSNDMQAPTAPTSLSSSGITNVSFILHWKAATDDVGVTGYDIYSNTVKIVANITDTFFSFTGAAPKTAYRMQVRAKDSTGNVSGFSSSLTTTTRANDTLAPTAPANLSSSGITNVSFILHWKASTDNVGVTGYDIYSNTVKIATNITDTFFSFTGAAPKTAYKMQLRAKDSTGNVSGFSSSLTITTRPADTLAPSIPANLKAANITNTTFTLRWNTSVDNIGVTGYDIYRNAVKINTSNNVDSFYNVTGCLPKSIDTMQVRARDSTGNISAYSSRLYVKTLNIDMQAPNAPANLSATNITNSSFTLHWNSSVDNTGVTGYDVYSNGVKLNTLNNIDTFYNIAGLAPHTGYTLTVTAKDSTGNQSAASAALIVTTKPNDTLAPTVPANLAATNITNSSFTLHWNPSGDNVGVTGYDVYSNGVKVNTANNVDTFYNFTALTPHTTYTLTVSANDSTGNQSVQSTALIVTTRPNDTLAPSAPTNLKASNITVVSFILRWSPSVDDVGVAGYNVYVDAVKLNTANIIDTFYNITGRTPKTTYGITVKASDLTGNQSGASTTLNVTTVSDTQAPSTPSNLKSSNITTTSYTLRWNASADNAGIAGYDIYLDGIRANVSSITDTFYNVTGRTPNTIDTVQVRAKDLAGNLSGFRLLYVTTKAVDTQAPSAPSNVGAFNINSTSFILRWNASTDNIGVTGYDIYSNGVKINTANIIETYFSITGCAPNTTYAIQVKAKDSTGNQSDAGTLNVTTSRNDDSQPPSIPANLAATNATGTSFVLTWNASADNTGVAGYNIYRDGVKINTFYSVGTAYSVTGCVPNTSYQLTVKAIDSTGNLSDASAALNVTTIAGTAASETFSMRTIIANQRAPNDLVYGPDNNIWYTERFGGTVSFVNPLTGTKTVVLALGSKMVQVGGQDGLMGLALHPQFKQGKPFVYISYTYSASSTLVRQTRIERYTYDSINQALVSPVTVLENIPGSTDHNSGRIAIGPDLKLYYTVGDMGAGQLANIDRLENAQNIDTLQGKILRLNAEPIAGSWIPADNPFTNGGQPTPVYTLGHRNPQGLVWGKVDGVDILYSSEHGPYSDDEINIIERGRNYGWPLVSGFCDGNYNGHTIIKNYYIINEQASCIELNVKEPLRSIFPAENPPSGGSNMLWPSLAPSGTEFYGSTAIPGWQNSLLVATLKGGVVVRYKLSSDGQSIISDTINYFKGMGRFRDVVVSPDGLKIYVACDSSGATFGADGAALTKPANPGSILEFTYVPASPPPGFAANVRPQVPPTDVSNKTLDVYPNPANQFILVYNYAGGTTRTAILYNMLGKALITQALRQQASTINVGTLASGVYILRVTDVKNKVIRTEKIVISH